MGTVGWHDNAHRRQAMLRFCPSYPVAPRRAAVSREDCCAAGNLTAETSADGTPSGDYIYLNGEPLAMKLYGSQAGWYYFINDHLGTPQKIVNEAGQTV